jgi:5'-nucleotidase
MGAKRDLVILVSNDDGIHSEGLKLLGESLRRLGEVFIIAPDRERSAVGHSLTLDMPLRLTQVGDHLFAVNGTPTDCIALGVLGILKSKPDLVVAGINLGQNLGDDITYSGTVSAAMEAALLRIPSFAVSLVADGDYRFQAAAEFSAELAQIITERHLPPYTLLNVNVPNLPRSDIEGVSITTLGKRHYSETVIEKIDPRGKKYYWIGGGSNQWECREGTDIEAINQNRISVTPLHLDLTDYRLVDEMRRWEIGFHSTER